ncbi:MAG: glycine--tRNA ligase subunit beta [Candidatus Coatesbacteria bacterium]|nr:glycine--tRNA ligase subunit beta [Candidatus Coatesbacteria bacterium]
MLATLLLEIRTEEIPVAYIEPALTSLEKGFELLCKKNLISIGNTKTSATNRRLVLLADDVNTTQKEEEVKITGPSRDAAFDKDGNLTLIGQKFLEKNNMKPEQIFFEDTSKGQKIACNKKVGGEDILPILSRGILEIIQSISFPKTMRWDETDIVFARPIRSIVALLNDRIVPLEIGNISSSNKTIGHWTLDNEVIIPHAKQYVSLMSKNKVTVSISKRKKSIITELQEIEQKFNVTLIQDDKLLNDNILLAEDPVVFSCSISPDFMYLPKEILITALKEHQRTFCFRDNKGNLAPLTAVVSNNGVNEKIIKSNEQVIFARLSDAKFFYEEDLKVKLDDRITQLTGIAFFPNLGNMLDKTNRLKKMSQKYAPLFFSNEDETDKTFLAAHLCKTDLTTLLIGEKEFNSLQGKAGEFYALAQGEDPVVAKAIGEHYNPVDVKDNIPVTKHGAFLAFIDRLDTLVGLFAIKATFTSSKDPYGLRRTSLGLIKIWEDYTFPFTLSDLIDENAKLYKEEFNIDLVKEELENFMIERLKNYCLEQNYRFDHINAVLDRRYPDDQRATDIGTSLKIITYLDNLIRDDEYLFRKLLRPGRRLANILKSANMKENLAEPEPSLFKEGLEFEIYTAFQTAKRSIEPAWEEKDFVYITWKLADLDELIHNFFEKVIVIDKDPATRKNRLSLLKIGDALFRRIANLTEIQLLDEEIN